MGPQALNCSKNVYQLTAEIIPKNKNKYIYIFFVVFFCFTFLKMSHLYFVCQCKLQLVDERVSNGSCSLTAGSLHCWRTGNPPTNSRKETSVPNVSKHRWDFLRPAVDRTDALPISSLSRRRVGSGLSASLSSYAAWRRLTVWRFQNKSTEFSS